MGLKYDLTGRRFGNRVVLSKHYRKGCWLCKCDCGGVSPVRGIILLAGKYSRCFRCARGYVDLTGRTFNKWTVIKRGTRKDGRIWVCACRCGRIQSLSTAQLKQEYSKSCKYCFERPDVRLRPYEALYNKLRGEAARLQRRTGWAAECDLSYEDFLAFTTQLSCHYCGSPIVWSMYNLHGKGQGCNLDRKDNGKGYVHGNVVVCCDRCNRAKGNRYSYDEWYGMTAYFRGEKN